MATEKPSAPDLSGYGSREWVAGFLDAEKIKSPKYFGDTRFAAGVMVRYVESQFAKLDPQQKQAIVAALSAEARLEAQADLDRKDKALIEQGRQLIASRECTRCHRFCQSSKPGNAPDLTGYASREWTLGLLADPTHSSFYGPRNDRMPVYVEAPAQVEKDRLAPDQVGLVTDWLRGQWYVEPVSVGHVSVGHVSNVPGTMQPSPAEAAPKTPVLLALGVWEARRLPQEKPPADHSAAAARALFVEEHCGLCHAHTGTPGGDIVPDDPSAPDLGGFASRAWIAGLLDPKQVDGPKYFGNSVFKKGDMVEFVKGNLKQLRDEIGDDELDNLIDALAAETRKEPKPGQKPAPPDEDVALLFEDFTCTDCHKFYGKGESTGPELTGYGSRAWLVGILSDPTARQFYGKNNYGMPSYRMFPKEPDKNLLDEQRLGLLAGWLRGKLEQPQPATTAGPRS